MYMLTFISLFYKIKTLFSYLPKELQEDVVDDMRDILELCILSKHEKMKGKI